MSAEQSVNLPSETEARWRMVETAWELGMSRAAIVVAHDPETEGLFTIDSENRRRSVAGSRSGLNGYQRGKCFYCFAGIDLEGPQPPDVDHLFAHALKAAGFGSELDGVWNLVLACRECNRGQGGKFDRVPETHLLKRLRRRNEYLISSHHPLRETLMLQTGVTEKSRHLFLNECDDRAFSSRFHRWKPSIVAEPFF